jgi:hypothetical protein
MTNPYQCPTPRFPGRDPARDKRTGQKKTNPDRPARPGIRRA